MKDLREGSDTKFASIFIVNAEENLPACHAMTIHATPATQLYWDGVLFSIRRPDWDEDSKYVGTNSKQNWIEIFRYAREAGAKGDNALYIQF